MSLNLTEDTNRILNRRYNVEYKMANGKWGTFNNILVNVDGDYFWFESEEDGLSLVLQDRVTFMYCTDRRQENGY